MILENNKNVSLLVDDNLSEDLQKRSWTIIYKRGLAYAITGVWQPLTKNTKILYLHRLILDAKPRQYVDHINGNTLDNRLENLRICSNRENLNNRGKNKNNTSGYKGVHFVKRCKTKPWCAQIMHKGQSIHLGYYSSDLEAAKVYDNAAKLYHKEFAKLNFPETK